MSPTHGTHEGEGKATEVHYESNFVHTRVLFASTPEKMKVFLKRCWKVKFKISSFVLRVVGRLGKTRREQLLWVELLFCVVWGCLIVSFPATDIRWNCQFFKGFSEECECNFPFCTNCVGEECKESRNCLKQTMYENEHKLFQGRRSLRNCRATWFSLSKCRLYSSNMACRGGCMMCIRNSCSPEFCKNLMCLN